MDALINKYPYVFEYYNFIATTLLPLKEYQHVYNYLMKRYKIEPDAFSAKWMGSILMNEGIIDSARYFLQQSLSFNNKDPQVWYNLSVTYLQSDKDKAVELLDKALNADPNYRNAYLLRNRILNADE